MLDRLIQWSGTASLRGCDVLLLPRWLLRQVRQAAAGQRNDVADAVRLRVYAPDDVEDGPNNDMVEVVRILMSQDQVRLATVATTALQSKYRLSEEKMPVHFHVGVGSESDRLSGRRVSNMPLPARIMIALGRVPDEHQIEGLVSEGDLHEIIEMAEEKQHGDKTDG